MLVPPMKVLIDNVLPARSISASTLIWLDSSLVGEVMTAGGGAEETLGEGDAEGYGLASP
jgi:hypothetical protein